MGFQSLYDDQKCRRFNQSKGLGGAQERREHPGELEEEIPPHHEMAEIAQVP